MLRTFYLFCLSCIIASTSYASQQSPPNVTLPKQLSGEHVLILFQHNNALSEQIARYYSKQRHIPQRQIRGITLPNKPKLTPEQFDTILSQLEPALQSHIKLIVLTFHQPYRVACMSITSAFAFGYDPKYCGQKPNQPRRCNPTAISPYYNEQRQLLWRADNSFRLSMVLSAESFDQAKALIDRGTQADHSLPEGNAYLVRTQDRARSTRWPIFKRFAEIWQQNGGIHAHYIDDSDQENSTTIQHKKQVLFYHTGLKHVPAIDTNQYLPGAIADHLTSGGGIGINHNGQMKAFRWLDSGATASYGAVIEPCNFIEKFPNPQILIPNYRNGDTLVEAYWKSVQQPGEGLFVGEPLARPWPKTLVNYQGQNLVISTQQLNDQSTYIVEHRNTPDEQWVDTPGKVTLKAKKQYVDIIIPNADARHYRIRQLPFYPGITELPSSN